MAQLPDQIPFVFNRAAGPSYCLNDGNDYGGSDFDDGVSIADAQGQHTDNTSTDPIYIFEELDDSPSIDLGEQATVVHRFKVDPIQTEMMASQYTRGSTFYDSEGRLCKVLTFHSDYQKGDYCIVTITSEGINFYIPPAECVDDPIEINPASQKHPRYAPLQQKFGFLASGGSPTPTNQPVPFFPLNAINQAVLGLSLTQNNPQTQALINTNSFYVDSGINGVSNWSSSPDYVAQAAALELLKKLRRGEETFYLAGYRVTYSTFAYAPQDLDPGGRIDDPVASGELPPEFWQDDNGNNIFTQLTQTLSPQFYQNGVSWFREADSQVYQRTWWRKTSTWIMAPSSGNIQLSVAVNGSVYSGTYFWTGQWDLQWYSPTNPLSQSYPAYDTDLNIQ